MAKKIDNVNINGRREGYEIKVPLLSSNKKSAKRISQPVGFGKKDPTKLESLQVKNPKK
jgi:hypothetical protein